MKLVVIAFLVVIVASLASALIYLIRDKGQSDRTVKALTVRVALSVTLFLLLMAGYYFGIIPQHGFIKTAAQFCVWPQSPRLSRGSPPPSVFLLAFPCRRFPTASRPI
jgi:hypothetical protein